VTEACWAESLLLWCAAELLMSDLCY